MMMWISQMMMPLTVGYIVGFALLMRRPVFEDFLGGARDGMRMTAEILPTLVGLMIAVGVLRTSGFLDAVSEILGGGAKILHLPGELIPLTLVRLVSNSAATGLLLDLFDTFGPDSRIGMAASVLMSSTETVFYCISIYFGAVKVRKTGWTLPGAFMATIAGIAASLWITR
ncbi:nucleoside recognition domain-containing protein [Brotaphodocola sp.]|uniref:nucleoside recognition domain-containing protein n=1 Tax=Brotaphodocola sp. TaxID=3073577 RepID=UPI003D7CD108